MTQTDNSMCGICLGIIDPCDSIELECKHVFHATCVVKWFRNAQSQGRCPICRDFPSTAASSHDTSERNEASDVLLVLEDPEFSVRNLHRTLAPYIYNAKYQNDNVWVALMNRYMNKRRFHNRAKQLYSDHPQSIALRRSEKDVLRAGYKAFVYLCCSV